MFQKLIIINKAKEITYPNYLQYNNKTSKTKTEKVDYSRNSASKLNLKIKQFDLNIHFFKYT